MFIFISSLALLNYIYLFFTKPEVFERPDFMGYATLIVISLITFTYIRFRYLKHHLENAFIVVLSIFSFVSVFILLTEGTDNALSSIIILTMILATSIILSVRSAVIYAIVLGAMMICINYFHMSRMIQFNQDLTEPDMINTIMFIFFIAVATYITKTGYEQIEHSYQRAYDYAKELEKLNKHLDQKVRLRTKQLQESIERQADSVHIAAIMGSIARPMLHDLSTPLSSLRGAQSLLKGKKFDADTKEIMELSREAVNQVTRIIENARNLMDNKNLVVEFSPEEIISIAIFVSKHELEKDNIRVNLKIDPKIKLNGVVGIFERIIVNIIINAAEELRQCEGRRVIDISGENTGKYFVLKIKDSGRGIKEEYLDSIFDADFTLKSERNLGFGLPFVKDSIEKNFGGDITVKSKVEEYAEFILRFDTTFNVRKSEKSRKNKKSVSKKKTK